jgi:glycosyltransferase involved in cell wall biosynthesis
MRGDTNQKVSVIMPCYNDGAYIEEAIASVRNQTYPDIELIVINDGSDEKRTLEKLDSLRSTGVTVLESNNIGPAGARNIGVEKAAGKYILPLDSDDTIDPTYIEKAVCIIDENEQIGGVYCLAEFFGKRRGLWELPVYSMETMLLDNVIFVTTLFRKSDWEIAGGFDESLKHGMEDYDFWLSIIEMGKEFYTIPEVLFFYRIKKKSRTSSFLSNLENTKATYERIYSNHKDFFLQNHEAFAKVMRNTLIDFLRRNYDFRHYVGIYRVIKALHTKVAKLMALIHRVSIFLLKPLLHCGVILRRTLSWCYNKTKRLIYLVMVRPCRAVIKRVRRK